MKSAATNAGRLIFAAFVVSGCVGAAQNEIRSKPTGHFGQLEYHRESGDLLGIEVFIVLTRSDYMAVVQLAEGAPGIPVVVPVTVERSSISFTVPVGDRSLRFSGVVRQQGRDVPAV